MKMLVITVTFVSFTRATIKHNSRRGSYLQVGSMACDKLLHNRHFEDCNCYKFKSVKNPSNLDLTCMESLENIRRMDSYNIDELMHRQNILEPAPDFPIPYTVRLQ